MKSRNFIIGALAALVALVSCEQEPQGQVGIPKISLNPKTLSFDATASSQTVTVTSTHDWEVEAFEETWIKVAPMSGKASEEGQTVTVTVEANNSLSRPVEIRFTNGMAGTKLSVNQDGLGGSSEAIYFNDFDKEKAEKEYGSGNSWPYLDQFDGWQNQSGTGAADVTYSYKGMSTRSNSGSVGQYSDYDGSGNNNMFFGSNAYLAVKNIALGGKTDLSLSFGTEKYSQDNGSVFTPSEFHIYLSNDGGSKWVELTEYTFAGEGTEGRWNLASAAISVPAGTETLSICFKVDVASSYRLDDLTLAPAASAGTAVDFSAATEMDFSASGNTGGTVTPPSYIADAIYFNNFDKKVADKTYGSGSSWPYLDQFDGWQNQTGTGAADVTYSYKGMSTRSNSTSNSNYSDYDGSGNNNMFFGSNAYLAVKNIALGGKTDLSLSFGTEKYSQENGNVFTPSEFHIYLSNDGSKWVELTEYSFAGEGTEGRWNLASASISVPAGTETLSICFKTDVNSSYRLDDLALTPADAAGTAVDFSAATEMDFNDGGSTGGGNTGGNVDYSNAAAKTVQEFITAADTETYFKLTGTISNFGGTKYCDFDLTDATGTIYVYSVDNKADWSDKIVEGKTVVLAGKYKNYNGKDEVVNAMILSVGEGSGEGNEPSVPAETQDVTVAEFLAAAKGTALYRLEGTVGGPIDSSKGSFDVVDESGKVFIYKATNFTSFDVKLGGTIVIVGQRGDYNGTPQMVSGTIESYDPSTETAVEPAKPIACTKIDKLADLTAGTYYMSGYLTAYTNTGNGNSFDWSSYPYHVCTGELASASGGKTDIVTVNYAYADGQLTKDNEAFYDAADVTLEAVEGKANTYYVKFTAGYLYATESASRKLAVGDTKAEWVVSDFDKGGVILTSNGVNLGTAGAESKLLRSYTDTKNLKYGLVFFSKATK